LALARKLCFLRDEIGGGEAGAWERGARDDSAPLALPEIEHDHEHEHD